MRPYWFNKRGYKHLDVPTEEEFALRIDDDSYPVKSHAWSPLLRYIKRVKRYKPMAAQTIYKERDIMYASHRDACILSKYAANLTSILDDLYEAEGLAGSVIGYRRLGKSNYDFSADAYRFAKEHGPCVVLCFDVTGFFDNLDHYLLKKRLKALLNVSELPQDWFCVFRHVTRFRYINRESLASHPIFGARLKSTAQVPIASIAEVKEAAIPIIRNENSYGIPQGTPISAVFSNLYMLDVDRMMAALCEKYGSLYQRYSDDILIICSFENEKMISDALLTAVADEKLEIKDEKTERAIFDVDNQQVFQYLGFNITPDGATIRPSSLARQWRKLKYSIAKTKKIGSLAIAEGRADKIFTKRLRRRFE